MSAPGFAYADRFRRDLPAPSPPPVAPVRINLGVGHNDPDLVPVEALADVAARVIRREGPALAIYNLGQSSLGHLGLREFIRDKVARTRGMHVSAEEVLITSGSLQGIDLVNALLLEPGDHVVTEEFTYGAVYGRLKRLGVTYSGAPLDEGGIRIDALEAHFAALAQKGVRPKYLYTIPSVQNPTGSVMPLERRRQLLDVCRRYGVPVFEDECYTDVMWRGEAPAALHALDPSQVIHIGSFSKSLAPALRVGYVIADRAVLARMLALKTDGGTPAIEQMIVAEYFREHFDSHLAALGRVLQEKLDTLIDALHEHFGTAAEVTRPDGGLFVWVRLPEGVDVRSFAPAAAARGVTSTSARNGRRTLNPRRTACACASPCRRRNSCAKAWRRWPRSASRRRASRARRQRRAAGRRLKGREPLRSGWRRGSTRR